MRMQSPTEVARQAIRECYLLHQRPGQAVWNAIEFYFGNLIQDLRAGELDPFHDNSKIEAFIAEVERRFTGGRDS